MFAYWLYWVYSPPLYEKLYKNLVVWQRAMIIICSEITSAKRWEAAPQNSENTCRGAMNMPRYMFTTTPLSFARGRPLIRICHTGTTMVTTLRCTWRQGMEWKLSSGHYFYKFWSPAKGFQGLVMIILSYNIIITVFSLISFKILVLSRSSQMI